MPRPKNPDTKIGAESSPQSAQVGLNIDAARIAAGLTWKELKEKLDELGHHVHEESLSRMARGWREVHVADLFFVAQVLNVHAVDLLVPRTMALVDQFRLDAAEANERARELEAEIADLRRQHVLDIVSAMRAAMVQS